MRKWAEGTDRPEGIRESFQKKQLPPTKTNQTSPDTAVDKFYIAENLTRVLINKTSDNRIITKGLDIAPIIIRRRSTLHAQDK